ncbi:hypothetical protein ACJIZ3_022565 [Penstemon smallii]|uniref:Uncharacterized protein n=1 Tax=Penstemon smallii TaxID=265156 RepID=A0ABD3TLM4_9LAMI
MDFEMLSRRELQALCKKNKIPANMTNLAMTDALKALKNVNAFFYFNDYFKNIDVFNHRQVEGMEEFMLPSQSETAQSSIESPEKMEVTSPIVPPTGGRTTRRRNVTKEEPETLQPTTRTRRTTRKTQTKDTNESKADATETPAVVQTTRRRAPVSSVCRKMESQLKECAEEKDVLVTPAPSGATSRRRRGVKEESVVQRVYSTRRSVRLAQKDEQMLDKVENETSDFVKKDLFTKDGGENVKLDDLDETSGITGFDANTTMEENIEGKDESEVVSAEEQPKLIGEEKELANNGEKEVVHDFEFDDLKQEKEVTEIQSQKVGFGVETKAEAKEEIEKGINNDKDMDSEDVPDFNVNNESEDKNGESLVIPLNVSNKVEEIDDPEQENSNGENLVVPLAVSNEIEESDDSHRDFSSEMEVAVENTENLNIDEDTGSENKAYDTVENLVVALPVSNEIEESDDSRHDFSSEMEVAVENTENLNIDEDKDYDTVENVVLGSEGKNADNFRNNEIEKDINNDKDVNSEDVPDFTANNEVLNINADVHVDVGENELMLDESESVILEAKEENADDSILLMYREDDAKIEPQISFFSDPLNINADLSENLPTSGIYDDVPSHQIVKPTCLTPMKMPVVSDNKENIDSEIKFVLTKESLKTSKNTAEARLGDLSVRQLSKMLKNKLIIANQLTKTENENEAPTRVALQAVPENRLVDEAQK